MPLSDYNGDFSFTIGGNSFRRTTTSGGKDVYSRTAGGDVSASAISKYSTGWLPGQGKQGGDVNIANGAPYTITHNLGTTDIHLACYVNPLAASDDGTVYSVHLDSQGSTGNDYRGILTTSLTINTVSIRFGQAGFATLTSNGSWVNEGAFNNSYVKFVVIG